jgi:hypothetical protein
MAEQIGNPQALTFVYSGGTIDLQTQLRNVNLQEETDMVDSTAGTVSYREYIQGLSDATLDVEAVYNAAATPMGTIDMKALRRTSGTVNYGPMGSVTGYHKISRAALVSSLEYDSPYDDIVTVNISFQLSGAPTDGTW